MNISTSLSLEGGRRVRLRHLQNQRSRELIYSPHSFASWANKHDRSGETKKKKKSSIQHTSQCGPQLL